ncbi:MAG: ATP-binding protein [Victivallales bacterium]|nr:ATP-binding protein [Victivallales bacterium]
MKEQYIHMEFPVAGGDFSGAGEAASKIKNVLKLLGVSYEIIRRVAIASYEAEINIVAHAYEGKISVDIKTDEICIDAIDRGPGIEDVERAMTEGYSTASRKMREMGFGAGMGLPNIKKASDWMQVKSEVGKGTETRIKFYLEDGKNAERR